MIVNIRGTNGSGKTTAVRQLIAAMTVPGQVTPVHGVAYKEIGTIWDIRPDLGIPIHPLLVVGRYDQSPCGGCDRLKTQDEITNLITFGAKKGMHVIFEGVIVSTIWGRYAALADTYRSDFAFAFMNTPFDVCLQRIRTRQQSSKRGERPIKVEQVRQKYDLCQRHFDEARRTGYRATLLDHESPTPQLLNLYSQLL